MNWFRPDFNAFPFKMKEFRADLNELALATKSAPARARLLAMIYYNNNRGARALRGKIPGWSGVFPIDWVGAGG